ncbi:hypothetical protein FIU90_10085 [Erythrobacter sp. THAF29]|nr:hypothetical protein FIU90_10085 [Erythrobacter sp. THAF29]
MEPIEYRIGEPHLLSFMRLASARAFRIWVLGLLAYAAITLGLLVMDGESSILVALFAGALALATSLMMGRLLLLPRKARVIYREDRAMREPVTFEFDDAGYTARTPSGEY